MKLGFGMGSRKKLSLADIEREAAAEIQMRIDSGKPPSEEWRGLDDRAILDTDLSSLGQWGASAATLSTAAAEAELESALSGQAEPDPEPALISTPRPARKPPVRKPGPTRQGATRKPAATVKPAAARKPAATRKPAVKRKAAAGE